MRVTRASAVLAYANLGANLPPQSGEREWRGRNRESRRDNRSF